MKRNFKFSIIMSVYNVEKYIDDAVNSIVNQTLNFKENVEIIFVNDGSIDESLKKCEKFKDLYGDNVKIITQKNSGLAIARLNGYSHSSGELVNFMDPDDILSPETLENVSQFYEKNRNKIDVVAIPIYMFQDRTGPHPLNAKFSKGTRIVDLNDEYNVFQLSMATAFFQRNALRELSADPRIVVAEDAKEIIKILNKKKTLGLVKEAKYNYRIRSNSLINTSQSKKAWYIDHLKYFFKETVDFFLKEQKNLPKFVQYTLLYELSSKFKQYRPKEGILSESELKEYQDLLFSSVIYFDNDVICNHQYLPLEHKIYLTYIKNRTCWVDSFMPPSIFSRPESLSQKYFLFTSIDSYFLLERFSCSLEFLYFQPDETIIEASIFQPFIENCFHDAKLLLSLNGHLNSGFFQYQKTIFSAGKKIGCRCYYRFKIKESSDFNKILFVLKIAGKDVQLKNISFGKYFPISKLQKSYFYEKEKCLESIDNGIIIRRISKPKAVLKEIQFQWSLIRKNGLKGLKWSFRRSFIIFLRKLLPENLWLITDKACKAGDNAEALFRYLSAKRDRKCYPIFIINKNSPDYESIKKCGIVIPYMSYRHKFLHYVAKHTISSYSHIEISTPFFANTHYFADLQQRNKIVFLQHGVTHNDVSDVLNKYNKNYSLFVVSSYKEKQEILRYGYHDDEVILTGLPRFDFLTKRAKKIICVMPTFRSSLVGKMDAKTSTYSVKEDFKLSNYYKTFESLFKNRLFLNALESHGYIVNFVVHPVLQIYFSDFKALENDLVKILSNEVSYKNVLSECSLMITDYSSVAFDFAFLRKPILYYQFETLDHYKKGYFDYKNDGFGDVVVFEDELIRKVSYYLSTDCKLENEYRDRIENFFNFDESKCCERVYEEILKMDN